MRRPPVSLAVFTLLVGRTVCDDYIFGQTPAKPSPPTPKPSVHDDMLAQLCEAPENPPTNTNSLPKPSLFQTGASTVQVFIVATAAPHALYVTDADGTVLAMGSHRKSNVSLMLPLDAMSKPQQLVPRAILTEGCTTVAGEGVNNWQAVVAQFTLADYEAAIGAGPHAAHAHGATHNLTEHELASAEPHVEVTADGRTTVRMLQRPNLYVPLMYVRSCMHKMCKPVVYVRRFTRSEWPSHAEGARTFTDATAAVAGWWRDPSVTSLFACAAMPVVHNCGGFPQRCTEIDVRAAVVARLEAAAAAAAPPRAVSSDPTAPLRVKVEVDSRARLWVRATACEEMRLYLKDGQGSDAAILTFRAHTELSFALEGNATAGGATTTTTAPPSAPRVVWAYRACGPLTAPTELRRSAPIELGPLLLAAAAKAKAEANAAAESGHDAEEETPTEEAEPKPTHADKAHESHAHESHADHTHSHDSKAKADAAKSATGKAHAPTADIPLTTLMLVVVLTVGVLVTVFATAACAWRMARGLPPTWAAQKGGYTKTRAVEDDVAVGYPM